jgi:hypothetical protein
MKLKCSLIGMFALATLAVAAPHTWTLKDGSSVEGDYVTSGTTTLVVKTGGTNCFLKISDLSTNDLNYIAKIRAAQRRAKLDAEWQFDQYGITAKDSPCSPALVTKARKFCAKKIAEWKQIESDGVPAKTPK